MTSRATFLPTRSTTQAVDYVKPLFNSVTTYEASKYISSVDFVDGVHVTLDPVGPLDVNVPNKGYVDDLVDAQAPILATGELIVHDHTTITDNATLAAGANNLVLVADNTTNSGLKWAEAPTAPNLAIGEVIVANATAHSNSALAAGTTNQVMISDSAIPTIGLKWGTCPTAPELDAGEVIINDASTNGANTKLAAPASNVASVLAFNASATLATEWVPYPLAAIAPPSTNTMSWYWRDSGDDSLQSDTGETGTFKIWRFGSLRLIYLGEMSGTDTVPGTVAPVGTTYTLSPVYTLVASDRPAENYNFMHINRHAGATYTCRILIRVTGVINVSMDEVSNWTISMTGCEFAYGTFLMYSTA
jgi:hypothetical protein